MARQRQNHRAAGITIADFPRWESRTKHTLGPASARSRGARNRRILAVTEKNGVEYSLHATKGIRRARMF